mgnify:CR=1 FL=1
MIRDGKKLPADVMTKIPAVIEKISADEDVMALYAFGSLAEGNLKPLSDLDFAVLLSSSLNKSARFDKSIDLIGVFNQTLKSDEVDLVIMNDDPIRFAFHILRTGKLLFCRDRGKLTDFIEKTTKRYLEFKPIRDRFDHTYVERIG